MDLGDREGEAAGDRGAAREAADCSVGEDAWRRSEDPSPGPLSPLTPTGGPKSS